MPQLERCLEQQLLSKRKAPTGSVVVAAPSGCRLRELALFRHARHHVHLNYMETMVERLSQIAKRMRVKAVSTPPTDVVTLDH